MSNVEQWNKRLARWKGRTALVTGATSGIGAACVHALAGLGMNVLAVARRGERLSRLAAEVKAAGGEVATIAADMRSEDDIRRIFAEAEKRFGGVDVLVNNAGLGYSGAMASTPTEEWREVLEVNVLAASVCMREALAQMEGRSDAAIINISSIAGHLVPGFNGGLAFYAGSKHALQAVSEGLRQELVASGSPVKLATISPGRVRTEFHQKAERADSSEGFYEAFTLEPEDIADAVVYLLSTPPHVQINDVMVRPIAQPH